MKKNFQLTAPGKAAPRVVEGIKNEIRRYVKRERKKLLPDGFDQWDFNCKVGADPATAVGKNLKEVAAAVDDVAKTGGAQVYVEILAVPARRTAVIATPLAGGAGSP